MAEKKKEVPKHILEFYKKDDKVRKLLDTTAAAHTEAYQAGLDVLRDDDGLIDYTKLEDAVNQEKFVDKMMDKYTSFAVKRLGLKEAPKDEFERDVIHQRYLGITRGELLNGIRKNKGKYTLAAHEKTRDKLIEKQEEELMPLRSSHFKKEHIDDILAHTGTRDYIAKANIEDPSMLTQVLDLYRQKGEIGLSDLRSLPDFLLTDKAKEGAKKLKDKYKAAA